MFAVRTRLILPVVNAGVMDERTSFHSWFWIKLTILRMTFEEALKSYRIEIVWPIGLWNTWII